jgi:hypothetical protein
MLRVNLDEILKYLKQSGYAAEIQKETQQIFFILKQDKREFPLFIKIFPDKMVQLLAFLPCQIKQEQIPSVARLLHILNREIIYPGFGMDEKARFAFFRCMIHNNKDEISEIVLEKSIQQTSDACKNYSPAVEALAIGITQLEDLLKMSDNK